MQAGREYVRRSLHGSCCPAVTSLLPAGRRRIANQRHLGEAAGIDHAHHLEHLAVVDRLVAAHEDAAVGGALRSEEHTSEPQSLMRISYAVFCLKKKKTHIQLQMISISTSNNSH